MPDPTSRGLDTPAAAARFVADRLGQPYERCCDLIRGGLQAGEIAAFMVGPIVGQQRPAEPHELTDDTIDFSEPAPARGSTVLVADAGEPGAWAPAMTVLMPDLEINLLSALRCATARWGTLVAPAPAVAPARDRGGRPTEHDWRRATRQVLLRVIEYGRPATKAELTAELTDWFTSAYRDPPDDRTLERFVAEIWPQGRCELQPRDGGA